MSVAIITSTGKTCYPAVPARDAVAPYAITDPQLGWTATARSVETIAAGADGYVEFEASASPAQVVAGFGRASVPGANTNPWLCTHAFYITTTEIFIFEAATGTHSITGFDYIDNFTAPADGKTYAIGRESGEVTYYIDGVAVYTSAIASTEEIYLDASLYRAGDRIDNARIYTAAMPTYLTRYGEIDVTLPALDSVFWGRESASPVYPHAGATDVGGQIGRADAPFNLPSMTATFTAGATGNFSFTLPRLDAMWSDMVYAEVVGDLPAVTGSMAGTQTDYAHTAWFIVDTPPMISYLAGTVTYPISIGEDGGDPLYMPLIDANWSGHTGAGSAYTYSQLGNAAAALETPVHFVVYFDSGFPEGWLYYEHMQMLAAFDSYSLGYIAVVSLAEGLELTDAFELYYFHDAELEEGAEFTDVYTLAEVVAQLIEEGVQITNALPQQDLDALQYAVNTATGALTTYRNFGFTSFCRLGDTTYAVRPGGLYKLRHGSDAGEIAGGIIDFGDHDFGTTERKNVDSLYLGLSNSGAVFARLTDDNGGENYYQVVQTEPTARVIAGRGVMARRYGLRLDIVDTSEFELDNIEFSVGVAVRRRMP